AQALGLRLPMATHRHLRERETLVTALDPKTWLARRPFTCAHAAKEGWTGQSNAEGNIVPDLRLHAGQRGPLGLQGRQQRVPGIPAPRPRPLSPPLPPLSEQLSEVPATLLQPLHQEALLLLGRVQALLERLAHAIILTHSRCIVKRKGLFIPSCTTGDE